MLIVIVIVIRFNEQNTAADYFGEQLLAAGYSYHGNEPMYSGITGTEMKMDIYIGVSLNHGEGEM